MEDATTRFDVNKKRSRSPDDKNYDEPRRHRNRRLPTPEIDDVPKRFKIYDGKVKSLKHFGAFVTLQGTRSKADGLVHVSATKEGARINDPADLLSLNQAVKVKVVNIDRDARGRDKISLSMREVDQITGRDLEPQRRLASGANSERLGGVGSYGAQNSVSVIEGGIHDRRSRKRLTSPERWEIKQLIASGAISALDYPNIDEEDHGALGGNLEDKEDIDIEVREEEPPFLARQTKQSLELSPIRVVKAPDGSLIEQLFLGHHWRKNAGNYDKQRRMTKLQNRPPKLTSTLNGRIH